MKTSEPEHLETRKRISYVITVTRNMREGKVQIAVGAEKEKGAKEPEHMGVPGRTAPPHMDYSGVIRVQADGTVTPLVPQVNTAARTANSSRTLIW